MAFPEVRQIPSLFDDAVSARYTFGPIASSRRAYMEEFGETLRFAFPFDENLNVELKEFGARWSPESHCWYVTPTEGVARPIVAFLTKHAFEVTEDVLNTLRRMWRG